LRIAFFSPPFSSHLQAMGAVAEALAARGQKSFLVGLPELASELPESLTLLELQPQLCDWSVASITRHARRPAFPLGVRRTVRDMAEMTRSLVEQGPALLRSHDIDAVVCDQMEAAGGLVAEHLGLPFVSVAVAAPINREPLVPLPVLDWPYENDDAAIKRNKVGERIADWLTAPHDRLIAASAASLGCAPKTRLIDCLSPLAQISQLTPALDFPRRHLPPHFHYVGALRRSQTPPPSTSLPPISSDRPFVFASLGTLQGHRFRLFKRIAQACRSLDIQLMIAHCGGLGERQAGRLGADWVVDRVSQAEALARADLVITHAGLNTVVDAVAATVPMLCIPLAFDQPGMAARVRHAGLGEVVSPRSSAKTIATALQRLLDNCDAYRGRATPIARAIHAAGGAEGAANLIEQAFRTRRPVLGSELDSAA
jgi:zeaxanthin glucosyltransferase